MKNVYEPSVIYLSLLLPTLPSLSVNQPTTPSLSSATGASNNTVLAGHVAGVRRCQTAVVNTAQLVQEQVAQLLAARQQLDSQRLALHQHLQAITALLTTPETGAIAAPDHLQHLGGAAGGAAISIRTSLVEAETAASAQRANPAVLTDATPAAAALSVVDAAMKGTAPNALTPNAGVRINTTNGAVTGGLTPAGLTINNDIAVNSKNVMDIFQQQQRSSAILNNSKSNGSPINISNPYLNYANNNLLQANNDINFSNTIQSDLSNSGRNSNVKMEYSKCTEAEKYSYGSNQIHFPKGSALLTTASHGIPINSGTKIGTSSVINPSAMSLADKSVKLQAGGGTNASLLGTTLASPYLHPGRAITTAATTFPLKDMHFNAANNGINIVGSLNDRNAILQTSSRTLSTDGNIIAGQSTATSPTSLHATTISGSLLKPTTDSGALPQYTATTTFSNNPALIYAGSSSNLPQNQLIGMNLSTSLSISPGVSNNKPIDNIGINGHYMIGSNVAVHSQPKVSNLSQGQPIGANFASNSQSSNIVHNSSPINLSDLSNSSHVQKTALQIAGTSPSSTVVPSIVPLTTVHKATPPVHHFPMRTSPQLINATATNANSIPTTSPYTMLNKNNAQSVPFNGNVNSNSHIDMKIAPIVGSKLTAPILSANNNSSAGGGNFTNSNNKNNVTTINLVSPTPPNTVPNQPTNNSSVYKSKQIFAGTRGASPSTNITNLPLPMQGGNNNNSAIKIEGSATSWPSAPYKSAPVESSDKLFYPKHLQQGKDGITNKNDISGNGKSTNRVQHSVHGGQVSMGMFKGNHSKHMHNKHGSGMTSSSSKSSGQGKSVQQIHGHSHGNYTASKKMHHASSSNKIINGAATNNSMSAIYKPLPVNASSQSSNKSGSKPAMLINNNTNNNSISLQHRQHKQRHSHHETHPPVTISNIPSNTNSTASKQSQKPGLQTANNNGSSSSGKVGKTNKGNVFMPYSTTSKPVTAKVQPWLPNSS